MRQAAKAEWENVPEEQKQGYRDQAQRRKEAKRPNTALTELKNLAPQPAPVPAEPRKPVVFVPKKRYETGFELYLDRSRKSQPQLLKSVAWTQWEALGAEEKVSYNNEAQKLLQAPPPAYQIFLKEFKELSAEIFPEATKRDLATAGSECWKELTSSAKLVYENAARDLREAHAAACAT